jgi:hypothetical protein
MNTQATPENRHVFQIYYPILIQIMNKPDITRRDMFFVLKRLTLANQADLQGIQRGIKNIKKLLASHQNHPPANKLQFAKRFNTLKEFLAKKEEQVEVYQKGIGEGFSVLFKLMKDDGLCQSWHEVAQFLGISHVAMNEFLKQMRQTEGYQGLFDRPSLMLAALNHAETFSGNRSGRVGVLLQAAASGMIREMHENPVFEYQCQQAMHDILGEPFPKPEPKRNFTVVGPGHG